MIHLNDVYNYPKHQTQVNQVDNSNNSSNAKVEESAVDSFIKNVKDANKKNKYAEYFWSPTASIAALVPFGISLGKVAKNIKNHTCFRKNLNALGIGGALYLGTLFGLQYLFNQNYDNKKEEFQNLFNKINTDTKAVLDENLLCPKTADACTSPVSGKISTQKRIIGDPLYSFFSKKLIRHELVHARQYETIARQKDGIKKLNYAFIKQVISSFDSNPLKDEIEKQFNEINSELQADKNGKYDNSTLSVGGIEINLKKYISAICTLINNPQANYNDIPMVIDEEHYKEVCSKKGPLNDEELKAAETYYQAMLNYPKTTWKKVLNPFSDYYNNALEKEAHKENPNLLAKINSLFS